MHTEDLRPDEVTPTVRLSPVEPAMTAGSWTPADPEATSGPARPPRRGLMRWVVAGVVVMLAIAGAAWIALTLGARPIAEALRYIPADAVVVGEIRPDLPGDQRAGVGSFLAHFPGFADQSTLDVKLDEALARLLDHATGGSVDYTTRVKPLLAGPLAIALTADGVKALSSASGSPRTVPASGVLIVATTDGKATCDGTFGATTAGSTVRGVEIRTVNERLSCAVNDRFLLIGDLASISAGIAARLDKTGIDGSTAYRAARDRLTGDQLGTLFVDSRDLVKAAMGAVPVLGSDGTLASAVPEWTMVGLRVVNDAVQVDVQTAATVPLAVKGDVPSAPPAAGSYFAALLPADTFGFAEWHGVGANLGRALAQLRADPSQAPLVTGIEQGLAAVGGTANVIGWMDDVAVAAIPIGDSAGAVVMIRGTSADVVAARLAQIRNLLVLASAGTDVTLHDAEHNGITVTTVDLGDLNSMLPILGLPAGALPSGGLPSGGRLAFALAAHGDVLYLGVGAGAIERVLDVDAAGSLATTSTYRRALELAGTPNNLEAFVAVDGVIAWARDHLLKAADRATWDTNVKPYVEHLAGFAVAGTPSRDGNRARLVLTVK